MIDKFGVPITTGQGCRLTNVVLKSTSVTGDLECDGRMSGKGSWQSIWSDPEHAKGSTHFVGTVQMGQNSGPVEFTTETTSVYKGADCGSVQPLPMPSDK